MTATANTSDIDWISLCRRAVTRLRAMYEERPLTADRATKVGRGAGGDETLIIDQEAEKIVFDEFDALHSQGAGFEVVSEERGIVSYGEGGQLHIVVDPVDGSLNAKRTIPSFSLSVAFASGQTMADVELAYVYDFGAEEEFWARLGEGAFLGGGRLTTAGSEGGLEVVGIEAADPASVAAVAQRLAGKVYRLRCIGSIALSLAYVAAGRFDGLVTLKPCRSVDAAASQLIAREAGAQVCFTGFDGPLAAPLDLEPHGHCVAARDDQGLAQLMDSLQALGS